MSCGGGGSSSSDDGSSPTPTPTPDASSPAYSFGSKFGDEDSTSYSGQTTRHALIASLFDTIKEIDGTQSFDVSEMVNLHFAGCAGPVEGTDGSLECATNESEIENHGIEIDGFTVIPGPTFGDISGGKNLVGKIAGNDRDEHILGDGFFGWDEGLDDGADPEDLVRYWTGVLEAEANSLEARTVLVSGSGTSLDVRYVDTFGRDYAQLFQKFLLGAVAFSQATADYLPSTLSDDNVAQVEGKPYTEAEHHWDEGFGYFGASRDYDTRDAATTAGTKHNDTNGDSNIDLRSEYTFGASTNCAKRDRGTASLSTPTDFMSEAFDAFTEGRRILAESDGALTEDELNALEEQIDIASVTWEKCLAATAVHYINDVRTDILTIDTTTGFTSLDHFKDYAKHWSELKGFALSLQFNPESPFRDTDSSVSITDLENMLDTIGDAPVLPDGTQAGEAYDGGLVAYDAALEALKATFIAAYGFTQEQVDNW